MRTLVIDCSQLCHAAFHTMGMLSYHEKLTGVLYGFLLQIFKLSNNFMTPRMIFCWDSRKSYRKDIFPSYKGDRNLQERTFEEEEDFKQFKIQMGTLRDKILPAMGFKNNFIKTGLEADDLIAYVVNQEPGVTVVSSDSDLYQLLDGCEMYSPRSKLRIDIREFKEKWGIDPSKWVEALSIAGTHNNVPGVPGAGIIKAVQYLIGGLPDGVIKQRIEASGELIERNRRLIKLPFVEGHLNIVEKEKFELDAWMDVFERYNFRSFTDPKALKELKEDFLLC